MHITTATIKHIFAAGLALCIAAAPFTADAKRARKAAPADTAATLSAYDKLVQKAQVSHGMFDVIKKDGDFYFEIPTALMNRDMLVVNKLVRVPQELNSAGVNRGINSSTHMVRFELDKDAGKVLARQSRPLPDVPEGDAIAASVRDNYISPIIEAFKIEAYNADSTAVVIKATDLYNGKATSFSNVFSEINIDTPVKNDLSKIKTIKVFDNNIYAISELTTKVVEPGGTVYVTVEAGSTLALLPEEPMRRRYVSPRVGYFTEGRLGYGDDQQRVRRQHFITRWRLEPRPEDRERYLAGELVEPAKPITFYLDGSTPYKWRPYITKGIESWNKAFEAAGFKDAVRVAEIPDSADVDDINYSTLTYAASTKSNAMGPSIVDPRSGEIIEADIIWWHNVLDILHDWIVVQTGAVNPEARSLELPEHLLGDAMRFVACHEVGHSLGLRHNMMASAAVPTDSLRSQAFVEKLGTSASIMDYARFNYVAQPGDGVTTLSPQIGPYDVMAIDYGYRWYGVDDPDDDYAINYGIFDKYTGPMYRYSEAQDQRDAVDPRALSEDLGDDPIKSAHYGIANLRRVVPNIVEWCRNGDAGQTYDEASTLLFGVMNQWHKMIYHVLANIGGIYTDNVTVGDGQRSYIHVDKERQRQAVQLILDEVFTYPEWLFGADVTHYTYLVSNTPVGRIENSPTFMLKNMQAYLMWDMLSDTRLIRMYENAHINGHDAFAATDMLDMMYRHIFAPTIAGRKPDLQERSVQKNYVDALITAANETQGIKTGAKTFDRLGAEAFLPPHCVQASGAEAFLPPHCVQASRAEAFFLRFTTKALRDYLPPQGCCGDHDFHGERTAGRRIINYYGIQANRISDAISLKRGELLRVRRLLKQRIPASTGDTRYHYEDLVMRINTALGFDQNL